MAHLDARRQHDHDKGFYFKWLDNGSGAWKADGYCTSRGYAGLVEYILFRLLLDKHSYRPCGLSRVRLCVREWRCLECVCVSVPRVRTRVGSRLAFRGKLVRAQSVSAYKALSEAA